MAANTTTPPTAPPTIAPIGRLLEDLLDAGLFVSDPVGDAPATAEFVADERVTVAEFTSDTPTLLHTDSEYALAAAMSALLQVASMQEAMLWI
jgi:hypothetical protein